MMSARTAMPAPQRPLGSADGGLPPRRVLPAIAADRTAALAATEIHDLPLLPASANARLEQLAAAGLPPLALMRRAGLAVARLALALAPHHARIVVLAGPGNNGGDGFEAATRLHAAGLAVELIWLGRAERQPADARAVRIEAAAAGLPIREVAPDDTAAGAAVAGRLAALDADSLVIDALLGRGLDRPAGGLFGRWIEALNSSAARVLAVDLPSGLQGDCGAWPASAGAAPVLRADATLALLAAAPGLFTGAGRDAAGEIWWHDLAVDTALVEAAGLAEAVAPIVLERGASLAALLARPRRHRQHKGSVGDLWVVGGTASMAGAALLAARAALHCGAGRVYVDRLDGATAEVDALQTELMLGRRAAALAPEVLARATVVAGCGGGQAIAAALPALLEHAGRLVLDADALNALAADAGLRTALQARATRGQATVLTPHPLEAARLLGIEVEAVQAERLQAARRLAHDNRVLVLLKGSGTVIATPEGALRINASGNAALATPGSGDVLAGTIGALWSRAHAEAGPAADPWGATLQATAAAAHLHGRVAAALSPAGEALPAGQLVLALGEALRAGTPR